MSLAARITALVTRVVTEINALRSEAPKALPVGDAVPGGTPAGTIIIRYVP